ncbi:DUF4393 domain-containing protein [Vibrio crassostreae]|uniref:DUF4393 domain-containing protein n=1 Tax=Vibrio crassostreae TaxID=246167 RepID=A0A822MUR1_9VIBR|nr:Abi-alpha family protein [Vibrio crassostreae]MDH5950391.1 DUF4393 domain-containing protein [Vibrio crassostreae]TCN06170.1 uncharacterized protein DUF4393 [Vibrio crassostreae]TCU05420.1 uncharacterized protein DUF4393 [Vibrio crassostreae]CAK1771003.1 DUF4393 domain-containing protein [Vibrio crassostreae]CAK1778062.1 DUF4393 domain-containing protein [Vibrio crassostreae]
MDENVVEKVINSKVVEKAYDDAISSPMVEISKVGVDVVKSARLLLAPLQIAASFQDRLEEFLLKMNERIPEQELIQAPAEVSSVSLEKMKYLDSDNPLWKMFEELLINASSSKNQSSVHPSFATIISQLSPDEAVMLYELNFNDFYIEDKLELNHENNHFENRVITKNSIPLDLLSNPDSIEIYYAHLESLSLVQWPVIREDPTWDTDVRSKQRTQLGVVRQSKMTLTDFGRLFVKATVPVGGFD